MVIDRIWGALHQPPANPLLHDIWSILYLAVAVFV